MILDADDQMFCILDNNGDALKFERSCVVELFGIFVSPT